MSYRHRNAVSKALSDDNKHKSKIYYLREKQLFLVSISGNKHMSISDHLRVKTFF